MADNVQNPVTTEESANPVVPVRAYFKEVADENSGEIVLLPKYKYLPGAPKQYRFNGQNGQFNINGERILLDEKGKNISSPQLANIIQQRANESCKQLVFLIGGAFGVDETIVQRANFTWSLSNLVFPHMLVRFMLAEQVYRACSILRNEKYHHQ